MSLALRSIGVGAAVPICTVESRTANHMRPAITSIVPWPVPSTSWVEAATIRVPLGAPNVCRVPYPSIGGTLRLWSMRSESVEDLIDFVQSSDSFVQTGGPRYEGELLPDR